MDGPTALNLISPEQRGGRQTMADRRGPSLFVRRALIKSFVLDSQCDTTVNTKKKFQTNMFSTCKRKLVLGLLQMCLAVFLWKFYFLRHNTRQQGCFYFTPFIQRCIIQYLHTTKSKLLKTSCFFYFFLKLFVKMWMFCYLLGFGRRGPV